MPTTQEKIADLIEEQYNGYRGRLMKDLYSIHSILRKLVGDEMFLVYLEKQKVGNPRPIYKTPHLATIQK